jgi:hypothetical protein
MSRSSPPAATLFETSAASAANVSNRTRHIRAVTPGNNTSASCSAPVTVPRGSILPGGSSEGS